MTSLADNLNVDGAVTLREAIRAAELDISVDGSVSGSAADLIQFAENLSGDVNLLLVGDTANGSSGVGVTTKITIRGNAAGITVQRSDIGPEMRLMRVASNGDLTLENITLAGGLLRGRHGTLPDESGGDAQGGAILNQGILRIHSSTLFDNEAHGGDGVGSGVGGRASGGAIYNNGGTATIINATLSGNKAQSGSGSQVPSSFAGAIYSRNGTLRIYNSTITSNSAVASRSVFVLGDVGGSAEVEIHSSIIGQAESLLTGFDLGILADDGGAVSVTGANNVIRRQNDFESITTSNEDPLLGPLLDNGGSTPTHALLDGSPAINVGSNPLSLSTDQRGAAHARVVGAQADIGAFEVQSTAGPLLPGDYNGNRTVDAADYVIWRKTLGSEVNRFQGADGNGNTSVDVDDFNVWRRNFGSMLGGAASITPSLVEDVGGAQPLETDSPAIDHLGIFAAGKPMSQRIDIPAAPRRPVGATENSQLILALSPAQEVGPNGEGSHPSRKSSLNQVRDNAPESGLDAGASSSSLLDAVWAEWPRALERF
ncbi:MAG TPA: choice-of-anchor Q domain-containing protein [Lacipirellulaceae bacterium]|nr:choice-of-anchor Q domain-containing protein [Lacipirellulaceae bacterium]